MLKRIINWFRKPNQSSTESVIRVDERDWEEEDLENHRTRRFKNVTESAESEYGAVRISTTTELATSRQERFLRDLGYDSSDLSKAEAIDLITHILRPIDYALRKTFVTPSLDKDDLRILQAALSHSEIIKILPRYGPFSLARELDQDDYNRNFTKEERHRITDIGAEVLPPEAFLRLVSNGVKAYKKVIDKRIEQDITPDR